MTRLTRRILGALPLIAGLVIAGVWVWTTAPRREREAAEAAIRVDWEAPAASVACNKRVDDYLARFGDEPSAVWFAAEAYGHLRNFRSAVLSIKTHPAAQAEAEAPRKLARLLLGPLSVEQGNPEKHTILWTRVLHTRLDARDPEGERDWAEYIPRLESGDVMPFFMPGQRTPSRGAIALGEGLASRKPVRELMSAGSILLAGPKHKDDVPQLLDNFHSSWRDERRPTWQQIARALGSTGDERAIAALREELPKTTDEGQISNRRGVEVALAVAGDRDAKERILSNAAAPGFAWYLGMMAAGYAKRLSQGDDSAVARLLEMWDRTPDEATRYQYGLAVLLADPAPPAVFNRWADELVQSQELAHRTLGHVWRYRIHADPPFGPLADDFISAASVVNLAAAPAIEHPDVSAAIETLRAWLRWGD